MDDQIKANINQRRKYLKQVTWLLMDEFEFSYVKPQSRGTQLLMDERSFKNGEEKKNVENGRRRESHASFLVPKPRSKKNNLFYCKSLF